MQLLVYDVSMRRVDAIPTLSHNRPNHPEVQGGLHAIEINPSRSFLATGARNSSDIAVYRLPTLDPVCVGIEGHRDLIMGMCWLDDQFLVSGSKDSRLALWRINEEFMDFPDGGQVSLQAFENSCFSNCHFTRAEKHTSIKILSALGKVRLQAKQK